MIKLTIALNAFIHYFFIKKKKKAYTEPNDVKTLYETEQYGWISFHFVKMKL